MSRHKYIIVGAGITGLCIAYYLQQSGISDFIVLESADKIGGKIGTYTTPNGDVIEAGADSFVANKPEIWDLIDELQIKDQVVSPLRTSFQIRMGNQFYDSPKGMSGLSVSNETDFMNSEIFSQPGKLAILNEGNVPPKLNDNDESLKDFIVRRFGVEYLERYIEPLFGGIYATPSAHLSLQACFPVWFAAERNYGSLHSYYLQLTTQSSSSVNRSPFAGFNLGTDYLLQSIYQTIQTKVILDSAVESISYDNDVYELTTVDGYKYECEHLISTVMPEYMRTWSTKFDNTANQIQFHYSTSAIITLVYQLDDDIVPSYSGFVSDSGIGNIVSAVTITTNKWKDRSPMHNIIIRAFVKNEDVHRSDMLQQTIVEVNNYLKYVGHQPQHFINYYHNSLPQYRVGHIVRISEFNSVLSSYYPNLYLANALTGGVGIPDRVKNAKELVNSILSV
ncbi:MAG: protoporphyrinogen oxidase [Bacteroidota bacterium]|nr:protoporphyrinogen oxidase [Bacteroidota bacterium]